MTLAKFADLLLNPRAGYVGRHRATASTRLVASVRMPRLLPSKQPS